LKRSLYLVLFVAGFLVVLSAAAFEPVPGYMDAEYYYSGGKGLAEGKGFYEPFLWNYLDDPAAIPHAAFTYWMPLPSLLASAGMVISGQINFFTARIFFILLASFIPIMTASIAWELTNDQKKSFLAGWLAIFPGFYLVYTSLTETFTPTMILGGLFLIIAIKAYQTGKLSQWLWIRFILLGIISGLMHLTRADGFIWLIAGIILIVWQWVRAQTQKMYAEENLKPFPFISMITLILGYGLIMAPWFLRNYIELGRFFPSSGAHTLWLTSYDQTFIYPASLLDFNSWWSAGFSAHLTAWMGALASNLKTSVAVQGEVILFPLVLLGLWRLRKNSLVRLAGLMWVVIFLLMTLVFPFSGGRGGFLHSGSSVQMLFWAVVPLGLDSFIQGGVRWRNWKIESSTRVFSFLLVFLCGILSLALFVTRVISPDKNQAGWSQSDENYREVEEQLVSWGVNPSSRVIVNNPPGYYLASNREAMVIPDGGVEMLIEVADKFRGEYLILESNHVNGLDDLYNHPADVIGIKYLGSVGKNEIFRMVIP
jgi:hypothetical protein